MTPAEVAILALYYLVLSALTVYSLHRFYLVRLRRRTPEPLRVTRDDFPPLTIQLPLYNEPNVAARLIDAVARIEYPGTLDIQVLDDSTDETTRIIAERIESLHNVRIAHVRRGSRACRRCFSTRTSRSSRRCAISRDASSTSTARRACGDARRSGMRAGGRRRHSPRIWICRIARNWRDGSSSFCRTSKSRPSCRRR